MRSLQDSIEQQRDSATFGSTGAIRPELGFDRASLSKTNVIVTGGANGIGEATTRAFAAAGAVVTFLDLSRAKGETLVSELGSESVTFVHGDVTLWSDQVHLFEVARTRGPIDTVIANAGVAIAGSNEKDALIHDQPGPGDEPVEPNLTELRVNLIGTIYTWKLAMHYFNRQPDGPNRCVIFTSSIAAYADQHFAAQYAASKWGVRGLMRALRSSVSLTANIRVNMIAPSFIRTNLMSESLWERVLPKSYNIAFATRDDAATALMHLAADKSLSGRSVAIVPRIANKHGYEDLNRDFHDVETIVFGWKEKSAGEGGE